MAQISINNLTFGYEGSFDYVFENVSFSAYSAKPAQPFQWNGALFRFNLNVVQID